MPKPKASHTSAETRPVAGTRSEPSSVVGTTEESAPVPENQDTPPPAVLSPLPQRLTFPPQQPLVTASPRNDEPMPIKRPLVAEMVSDDEKTPDVLTEPQITTPPPVPTRQDRSLLAGADRTEDAGLSVVQVLLQGLEAARAEAKQRMSPAVIRGFIQVGSFSLLLGIVAFGWRCLAFDPIPKVAPTELVSATHSKQRVELKGARLDLSAEDTVDLNDPVLLTDIDDLMLRQKELMGRMVTISGEPKTALITKTEIMTDSSEYLNIEEEKRATRVFAPLKESPVGNGLWVLSLPQDIRHTADSRVKEFLEKGTYTGMLQPLKKITDLTVIRTPSSVYKGGGHSLGPNASMDVPEDALAVVAMPDALRSVVYHFAPVVETEEQLWVVGKRTLAQESRLIGDYKRCPIPLCWTFAATSGTARPVGFVLLNPDYGYENIFRLNLWGILLTSMGLWFLFIAMGGHYLMLRFFGRK
ncbi:MAG: hypothetical protein V1754_14735 [Pseudomonadota bacterium]